VCSWAAGGGPQIFTLAGYAGTGKTTTVREIIEMLRGSGRSVSVCAPTGKAAYVLRTKGIDARTVHKTIYTSSQQCSWCGTAPKQQCLDDSHPKTMKFVRLQKLDASMLVVDEASMVSDSMHRDLAKYGVPILYVGDHGQLEPVGDDPGLMRNPDVVLETIHRQADGNGIIQFAHSVRQGIAPLRSEPCENVVMLRKIPEQLSDYDVVLCGRNATRVAVNAKIRRQLGFSGDMPERGERVICLQNNYELGIWNGLMGTVTETFGEEISFISDDGTLFEGIPVHQGQFGRERKMEGTRDVGLFDHGYCLTVHKSQGSEWDRVLVLDQGMSRAWSAARWWYTAATRAAKELTWIVK
jgi:exodeoxyribonuclease-5